MTARLEVSESGDCLALSPARGESVQGAVCVRLLHHEVVEVQSDLADGGVGPAHGVPAGRDVLRGAGEVAVVEATGAPAASTDGAANSEPAGTTSYGAPAGR